MLPLNIQNNLDKILKSSLVIDIECSSYYQDGREIDIKRDFDNYILNAQVKWVGAFSFKNNKSYYINAITHRYQIAQLLKEHDVIVSFNGTDFDWPIIVNNNLVEPWKKYLQVDLMQVLGTSNQMNRDGYKFKNRAQLMGIQLKNNSLRHMAEAFGLETQKGEIDFRIFQKNEWSEEETNEILKYLSADVLATKELFNKTWFYWLSFAELLDEKFVYDLSWIRSSIASVTYKAACRVLNVEPTYAEGVGKKQEIGGNVYLPKYEEACNVWHVDVGSEYPHCITMLNLCSEIKKEDIDKYENVFHGNDIFKLRGYYNISEWHPLCKYIAEKLKERIHLKETDPTHPMVYTLKILLNGLYGSMASPLFEKIHTENIGNDTCLGGQAVQNLIKETMEQFGFEHIGGDTDAGDFIAMRPEYDNKEYVQNCLGQIVKVIKDNVPFPVDTFNIAIEKKYIYVLFPFSDQEVVDDKIREQLNKKLITGYIEKEINKKKCVVEESTGNVVKIGRSWVKARKAKKKHYLYIYEDKDELKVKLVGVPLIKDTATKLGNQIFKEVLEPLILKNKRAKFPKEFIDKIIDDYLKKDGVIESLATEYRVQKFEGYKNPNQIQAQISKEYFGGEAGVIRLIKNTKVGKVGKGMLYCSIQEAKEANLTAKEIDLERINNELEMFIASESLDKNSSKPIEIK